jgi:myo-inositol-1(or 4)-monophosphatase
MTTPDHGDTLDLGQALGVAVQAVQDGCAALAKGRRKLGRLRVNIKNPGDISTEIDRLAETAIIRRLRAAYPSHAFTGEESGDSGASAFRWIVDPLDGTVNYVHGFPYYAVSLALEVNGKIALGVVADPVRKEFFTAVAGRGAYLNGKRLRVSSCQGLELAVVGTVVPPPRFAGMEEYLEYFCRVARTCAGVRRAGAAALDLAYVAAGRLDGFFVVSLHAWDIAAGSLLVAEAGGAVADLDGAGDPLRTNRLVAANPVLLPEILALFRR